MLINSYFMFDFSCFMFDSWIEFSQNMLGVVFECKANSLVSKAPFNNVILKKMLHICCAIYILIKKLMGRDSRFFY